MFFVSGKRLGWDVICNKDYTYRLQKLDTLRRQDDYTSKHFLQQIADPANSIISKTALLKAATNPPAYPARNPPWRVTKPDPIPRPQYHPSASTQKCT